MKLLIYVEHSEIMTTTILQGGKVLPVTWIQEEDSFM